MVIRRCSILSCSVIGRTEKCLTDFVHSALGKSSDTNDLALMKLDAKILYLSRNCQMLTLQHYLG